MTHAEELDRSSFGSRLVVSLSSVLFLCLSTVLVLLPREAVANENTPPLINLTQGYVFGVHPASSTNSILFTVTDAETPAEALRLSATSSNQQLISNDGISFGGSGTNRTLIFTPKPREGGVTRITVTVEDLQGGASTTSVVLTGYFCNAPPSISDILSQTMNEDEFKVISFLVSDCNSLPEGWRVIASSSNDALIPTERILFSGTGERRTAEFRPLPDRHGTALITLMFITDQGLSDSTTFILTVLPVNDSPFISPIADLILTVLPATNIIAFTVTDIETPAEVLKLSAKSSNQGLVPDNAIAVTGSGTNRNIIIAPLPYPYRGGETRITITAEDPDGGISVTSFSVFFSRCQSPPRFVTGIPDLVLEANRSSGVISFEVDYCNSPPEDLTVTAKSLNELLIPERRIAIGGAGRNRTIQLDPLPNTNGTATIRLTVSFGTGAYEHYLTSSVKLTVLPAVNPPSPNALFVSVLTNTAQAISLSGTYVKDAPFTYQIVTAPTKGTLTGEPPGLIYHPYLGARGLDSFRFKINDGTIDSAPVAASIEITEKPLIRLMTPFFPGSGYGFGVAAPSGWPYSVETSSDLVNWTSTTYSPPTTAFTNTTGIQFFAPVRRSNPQFFRAKFWD